MKRILLSLFLCTGIFLQAQSIDYNTKKGYVANGYDVVSYFEGKPQEGIKDITTEYDGVSYKFSSHEHLIEFKANPKKYIPQYGGYCAYAVAVTGKKVNINPETFEIRDGKLFLFYNAGKTNTLELWQKESPEVLIPEADKNWEKIKN